MEFLQFLALLVGVPALLVGVVAGLIWLVMRWLDYPGTRLLDRWKDAPGAGREVGGGGGGGV